MVRTPKCPVCGKKIVLAENPGEAGAGRPASIHFVPNVVNRLTWDAGSVNNTPSLKPFGRTMKNFRTRFLIRNALLPASSGVLLLLVFPPFSLWFVAFFAWLPLLVSLDGKPPVRALQSGGITGVVFFGFLVYWLSYVTTLGYALLVFYLSLYPAVFCSIVTLLPKRFKRLPETGPRLGLWEALQSGPVARPLGGGLIWACLEYLRSSGPFSFSWGLLGHSQVNMPHLGQSVGWWGVYGLSFLLMATNLALAEFWRAHKRRVRPRNYWFWPFAVLIRWHWSVMENPRVGVPRVRSESRLLCCREIFRKRKNGTRRWRKRSIPICGFPIGRWKRGPA
jgi:hypothetical protein